MNDYDSSWGLFLGVAPTKFVTMFSDDIRIQAYYRALKSVITRESVVLDIGTGIGIFALLTAHLGAKHVYAIDPNDAIHVGKKLAVANNLDDRITFIQGYSTKVTLPQRADIIVSEIRGYVTLSPYLYMSMTDAVDRHLQPDGIVIPEKDVIWVAGLNAPNWYHRTIHQPTSSSFMGLDLSLLRDSMVNRAVPVRQALSEHQQMELKPQVWHTIQHRAMSSPHIVKKLTWTVEKESIVHCFVMWFDAYIFGNEMYTSYRGSENHAKIYADLFFPLSQPLELSMNEVVELTLHARLIEGRYIWVWHTIVYNVDGEKRWEARQTTWQMNAKKRQYYTRQPLI